MSARGWRDTQHCSENQGVGPKDKEEGDKKLFKASYEIYKKLSAQGVDVSSIQDHFNQKDSLNHRDYLSVLRSLYLAWNLGYYYVK